MALPYILANGIGNVPDAAQLMANFNALVLKGGDTMTGALALGAGATFGNVASPSGVTLDYYGEGTFVPVVAFGGASVGVTYSLQSGRYTRIGRLVQYEIRITLSSKGSSTGSVTITGLPFTAAARAYVAVYGFGFNTTPANPMAEIDTTTCFLVNIAAGTVTALANTDFTNTTTIEFTGTYSV